MIPKTAALALYKMWPMVTLFIIVMTLVRITYIRSNNEEFVFYKEVLYLLYILYILFLFELVTNTDFLSYSHNFKPFSEILRYPPTSILFYRNVVGNILLFMPFGFFTAYYTKNSKFKIILLITFISSFSIEIIQSLIGRTFDIDDIILNVVGSAIGFFIYKISKLFLDKQSIKIKNNLLVNLVIFIIIIILIYVILTIYGVYLWTHTK